MQGRVALSEHQPAANPIALFVAATLLVIAVMLSFVFYGTGANLLILALVIACLLASLVCIGPSRLADQLATNRGGFALALAILGYLTVAYRLSISPDNSFAASWVLAAGPLAFICGSAVTRHDAVRRALTMALVLLVVAMAANSCVRFVLFGERAHQPMIDPNNYAALIYLVWIPLAHSHLSRVWQKIPTPRLLHGLFAASTFILILAVFATRSRTSLLVVAGAFVVWLAIVAVRRASSKWLLVHLCAAGVAWCVAIGATVVADASIRGLEFGTGVSVRHELIRAALVMFTQHPLGIGVFCFPLLYPRFRSTLEQDTAGLFVHNDYVQFLVEGGIPLLLLLLLFVGTVLRRSLVLVRLGPDAPNFANFGLAMALAAVCTHAFVNFVFYSLPLSIVIGLIAARLFSDPIELPSAAVQRVPRGAVVGGLGVVWVVWLYLVLDVATVGVFQLQPSFGVGEFIRADERRMLQFARVAQRLNGNRGMPVLGEATLLYRAARAEPESAYLKEQAYRQFHLAMLVDPVNTWIYVRLAGFLDEFPPDGGRPPPGESAEELFLTALSFDPLCVPALDQLLQLYAATGQDAKAYMLLRDRVYVWMPTLRRNNPEASDRYFDLLERYASADNDAHYLAELKERRAALVGLAPKPEKYWFF
jgi:O-antigen ligase